MEQKRGLSIASLACGIVGLITGWCFWFNWWHPIYCRTYSWHCCYEQRR